MRSAEQRLAVPMDNQKGKKRGPYAVGGMSLRSSQEKRKKLKQQSLTCFKKRPRAPSASPDYIEIITLAAPPPAKRQRPDDASGSTVTGPSTLPPLPQESDDEDEEFVANEAELGDEVETSPDVLETEARAVQGDAAVDSIVVADEIAEWVDTILDDAAPLDPAELASLAVDGLKKARKSKDFRSTVLFAALADFYRWMPRMGRLPAPLRVAKNHGRGPEFQRVLCAQARFFEANGALKPSHQGRREKQNGLLDDEGFYMGVQRWLRTLEVGTVNPKLLQQHVNETLLPSLSLKRTTVSVGHCQRWLWKLGYRRKQGYYPLTSQLTWQELFHWRFPEPRQYQLCPM
ncbi:hypothetical protein B0H13DRAFT_1875991 [Mycena leptocephala]|nr:hypothetical protein B0H13DRAFT_1875991 [Mycena leptocephala]